MAHTKDYWYKHIEFSMGMTTERATDDKSNPVWTAQNTTAIIEGRPENIFGFDGYNGLLATLDFIEDYIGYEAVTKAKETIKIYLDTVDKPLTKMRALLAK